MLRQLLERNDLGKWETSAGRGRTVVRAGRARWRWPATIETWCLVFFGGMEIAAATSTKKARSKRPSRLKASYRENLMAVRLRPLRTLKTLIIIIKENTDLCVLLPSISPATCPAKCPRHAKRVDALINQRNMRFCKRSEAAPSVLPSQDASEPDFVFVVVWVAASAIAGVL
jgi:hypothetical protein